jgi:tryptophan-rich sensory protein
MRIKSNYLIIPLLTIVVAALGSLFTDTGMFWYGMLKLPSFTPPGWIIGMVWSVIFAMAAASLMIIWNRTIHNRALWTLVVLFVLNGILNALWSWLFFVKHDLMAAFYEAAVIEFSVLAIIISSWRVSRLSALLMVPYAGWVIFATYLTWLIWQMNG